MTHEACAAQLSWPICNPLRTQARKDCFIRKLFFSEHSKECLHTRLFKICKDFSHALTIIALLTMCYIIISMLLSYNDLNAYTINRRGFNK